MALNLRNFKSLFLTCVGLFFLFFDIGFAEKITPSHVFLISQETLNELDVIFKEKNLEKQTIYLDFNEKRPRHVWQKSREVLDKISKLKAEFHLQQEAVPPVQVKEIEPGDVYLLAKSILRQTRELKEFYSIYTPAKSAEFLQGKAPKDVYQNMTQISRMLDRLLQTSIRPEDVYRVILTAKLALKEIYDVAESKKAISPISPEKGKSPRNVYKKAYALLSKLDELTNHSNYQIEGGVVKLDRKVGRITPSEVMDLMNHILAEINAIKSVAGLKNPLELPLVEKGKTPSDVYNETLEAIAITEALL